MIRVVEYQNGWWVVRVLEGDHPPIRLTGPFTTYQAAEQAARRYR